MSKRLDNNVLSSFFFYTICSSHQNMIDKNGNCMLPSSLWNIMYFVLVYDIDSKDGQHWW